jgi:hypothetical protein
MAQRKRARQQNLFIETSFYSQHADLSFIKPILKSRFKLEMTRLNLANLKTLHQSAAAFCLLMGVLQFSLALVLFSIGALCLAYAQLKPTHKLYAGLCLLILPQMVLADSDAALVFLPTALLHFFNSEHWKSVGYSGVTQLVVLAAFTNASFQHLLIGLCSTIGVYILLERLLVDMWVLLDSYKRSNTLHYELFNSFKEGILIVDLDGRVKSFNKAVFKFLRPTSSLANLDIRAIFPSYIDVEAIVRSCARGDCYTNTVSLMHSPQDNLNSAQDILAYKVIAQPATWVGGNCIKITLKDETDQVKQIGLTLSSLTDLQNSCSILSLELERNLKYEEPPRREDLIRLNSVSSNMQSLVIWTMISLGYVKLEVRQFDIREEVVETIDACVSKHLDRLDDVVLVFNPSFPTSVVGDLHQHNLVLKGLITYALQTVSQEGGIKVYCDFSVSSTQPVATNDFKLSYKVVYPSSAVSSEVLSYLASPKGVQFEALLDASKQFGLGFAIIPILLAAMEGRMVDSYAQPDSKIVLAYR